MASEMPIYIQTHDMLAWLLPHLESWPRSQRFFLAREVTDSATHFYRSLLRARKVDQADRIRALLDADVELETLKGLLRLGQELEYMNVGQYQHISKLLVEIGKQVGGWRASLEHRAAQSGGSSPP